MIVVEELDLWGDERKLGRFFLELSSEEVCLFSVTIRQLGTTNIYIYHCVPLQLLMSV